MYYIRFDDSFNRHIQPWDAVMMAAHSTARLVMLASQSNGNEFRRLFFCKAPNCIPIPCELGTPTFDTWLNKYWRAQKEYRTVFSIILPARQLFHSAVEQNLSDLIFAIVEKDDKLVLFSNIVDGLCYAGKEIKPTSYESILLLGLRPSFRGFFDNSPTDRYYYVPHFPVTCGNEIFMLRKAFSEINVQQVKEIFEAFPSLSDTTTGGLVANAMFAIMLNGGFSGRSVPIIEDLLRFLILEKSADVNFRLEEDNGIVLHLLAVCFANHSNTATLVQMLKRFGAELSMKNNKGDTPIITAQNHLTYNKNVITALTPGAESNPFGENPYGLPVYF